MHNASLGNSTDVQSDLDEKDMRLRFACDIHLRCSMERVHSVVVVFSGSRRSRDGPSLNAQKKRLQ